MNPNRCGPRRAINLEQFMYPEQPFLTVHQAFCDYSHERLIKRGKECLRAWIGFNKFFEVVKPEQDAAKITTGQVEDYVDLRQSQGVTLLTVCRELAFVKAAINNAHRRNRIDKLPFIEPPDARGKPRRPLTEDEFRLVISQSMSDRLRRFYWAAYHTGHRSTAIEELVWARVSLAKRTIDFNVPGRAITNKRRNAAFPITNDFLPLLMEWKEKALDEYVIGAGPSTYHEAAYVVRELCGLTDPALVPRHCMRAMYATEMFEKGVDPEIVGKLMEDDPKTLRTNYVKWKHEVLLTAANVRAAPRQVVPA